MPTDAIPRASRPVLVGQGLSGSVLPKAVMRDLPLPAFGVAEKLGAGHEENPPIDPPAGGVVASVDLGDERLQLSREVVLVGEPGLGGFLVVGSVDQPLSLH